MLTISLGSRIACDGEFGTVLYVGEVNSTPGIWIGIEWDNPDRGKHDGSHNGKCYFKTSHPTSGSFTRPTKVDFGKQCRDAIYERYQSCKDKALDENTMLLPQRHGIKRSVEFVGLEKVVNKQSQFNQLKEIDLGGSLVSGAGNPNELSELIPNVTTLDLSHNLLSSWASVADITKQLPGLVSLNLSNNRLSLPENPSKLSNAFKSLKELILNKMSYDWSQVMACAVMWPEIEYLDLWSNKITKLTEVPSEIFANLRFLNISDNIIGSWEEVCKLGTLDRLETLIVENASIPNISFPITESSTDVIDLFKNLTSLSLVNNKLSKWRDIAELSKLQSLTELRIKGNPVLSLEMPGTSRQFVIAKLRSLKRLNRLEITRKERRGAELDYLKHYCKEWLLSGGHRDTKQSKPSKEFLDEHPTYLRLLEEYGAPENSELKQGAILLKNELNSVHFYCPSKPNMEITRKLPDTMTIAKLKILLRRLFKLKAHSIILSVVSSKESEPEIEMDDMREISFYSLRKGDRIRVQEKA